MNGAMGHCQWRYAIGVLAIGLVACSAYGAMAPITNNSEGTTFTVDPNMVPGKWASTSATIDVSQVIFNAEEFGGLRDTGFCAFPVGGPNHTCPGGTEEGEIDVDPTCGLIPGGDNYNAGCNSPLEVFGSISCGETICGTWATVVQGTTVLRDTDWYEVQFAQRTKMIVDVTAEFDVHVGIVSSCGTGECGSMPEFPDFWAAGGFYYCRCNDCDMPGVPIDIDRSPAHLELCVEPGYWWVFISGDWAQAPVDCRDYTLRLTCEAPCHVACCTGFDECMDISSTECRYTEEVCGPGHYGGAPQPDPDCVTGLCIFKCTEAVLLTCDSSTDIDNSVNNYIANPPMSCATGDSVGVLWFKFVATDTSAWISTCATIGGGDPPDSVFALYEGDCVTYLTELACSEDEDCGPGDWLGVICYCGGGSKPPLEVGETYYIQFAAWIEASQGAYTLEIDCPCEDCAPAACCLPGGSCTFMDQLACEALEPPGSYQGFPTTCETPDVCIYGACCDAEGGCAVMTETVCDFSGVQWIAGAICEPNPCAGACCTFVFSAYSCTNASAAACADLNQTFYPGEECPSGGIGLFSCPDYRKCTMCKDTTASPCTEAGGWVCPTGPWECVDAKCQLLDPENWPAGVVGAVADANVKAGGLPDPPNGVHRADDFIPASTPINEICWWGFYRDGADPMPDPPQHELTDHFTVTYYASDANKCPLMPPLATRIQGGTGAQALTVVRTFSGERVLPEGPYPAGHMIYLYEGKHTAGPVAVTPGDCYWVEITNNTDVPPTGNQTRLWFWSTAPFVQGNGFSLSNHGQPSTGYEHYMFPGQPCHSVTWRDFDLAFCVNQPMTPCEWCADVCAGATVQEGEPACGSLYLDSYNEGCSPPMPLPPTPPNMVDVQCGDVVCGKTGTYTCEARCADDQDCPVAEYCQTNGFCTWVGSDPYNCRDVDWYRLTLDATYEVEVSLTGTAPMYTEMYNPYGVDQCRASLGQLMLIPAPACHSDGDMSLISAGVYYLFTAPDGIFEGLGGECGDYEYAFYIRCVGGAQGACCDDVTGECDDNVAQGACADRFAQDTLCADLDPPCVDDCTVTDCDSCRTHGTAGRLCLDMGISGGVEPRLAATGQPAGSSGLMQLDITLDDASAVGSGVTVDCGTYNYTGTATASVVGNVVTVSFSPALPDKYCCTVTLDCDGGEVCVCGLQGDIDRGGLVTTGDASIIKPKFGQTATAANAQYDYDASGVVTPGDFSLVKSKFGNELPPAGAGYTCPSP